MHPKQKPRRRAARPRRQAAEAPVLGLHGRDRPSGPGSNRAFGFVFAAFAAAVGLWPALWDNPPRPWALVVAAGFAVAAAATPAWLAPLNRAWFLLGMALHRVVSPVVIGIVYFLAVTPTGWLLRLFRKDILRLRPDPEARSYWIVRDPPGPEPESMKNQY